MESLLSKINTRMNYISSNTDNAYITKQLNTIKIKLQEIKERKYSTQEGLDYVCNRIINCDIMNMKGVNGQTNMVYKKMQELSASVEQIKTAYFVTDDDTSVEETIEE